MVDLAPSALVVVSDERLVDPLMVALRHDGFDLHVARDGRRGLQLFGMVRPDIVPVEVVLPGVAGVESSETLRRRSAMPIVLLGSAGADFDPVAAFEVGVDDAVPLAGGAHRGGGPHRGS